MGLVLDAIYAAAAAATAPWWLRKARSGWAERFGRVDALPAPARPRVLLHAVSVGEVNATRPLVDRLKGEADVVVSTTTDTGIARARELFAGDCEVVRYPLDASWSVRRFLDAVRPDAVALVELELWPQFVTACARRGIPVGVVNGRLSERSFKRYRLIRWYLGRHFRSLAFAAVQDDAYAARFGAMGVPPDRLTVAGSMKWDAVRAGEPVEEASALAEAMAVDRSRPLVVAGSTAPDEHALLRDAVGGAGGRAQLLCAPRRPEWFDGAAADLPGCVRRSAPGSGDPSSGFFLLDTIGELRAAYALADVVVVGRSFGDLHGSDPMEPAGLARPIVIGPAVADFEAPVADLEAADAIVRSTRASLAGDLERLLDDEGLRRGLGERAAACAAAKRGAADRQARIVLDTLNRAVARRSAAP